jgi:hypothetical protein
MLEHATTKKFTELGRMIASDKLFETLSNLPKAQFPEGLRLHIPRAIRVVYDIRNKRDAAHLADDIDPNLQDASLVVSNLDWILAEFIRLYHKVSANEATKVIDGIVTRKVPVVEDFDGFLKVLNPSLKVSGYILVLLYERGSAGATLSELEKWVRPSMRTNLRRTLNGMVDDALLHENDVGAFFLTKLGRQMSRSAIYTTSNSASAAFDAAQVQPTVARNRLEPLHPGATALAGLALTRE